jgi:hypothetical protein
MPIVFVATVLVQILCIVHVIRTRRNTAWIMAIGFLPLVGSIAYFVVKIMPTLSSNRHVRTAQSQIVAKIDPERDLRSARERLSIVDTAANRTAVADAYTGLSRHAEALLHLNAALNLMPGDDPQTQVKLARALFETGDAAGALQTLDALGDETTIGEGDRRALLRARVLNHLGRNDDALALYRDVVTRLPGEEARCRYAALLIEMQQPGRAKTVLEDVEARMKRMDRTQRAAESDMYEWAMAELKRLRAA